MAAACHCGNSQLTVVLPRMQQIIHYFLHFGFPVFVALLIDRSRWFRIYVVLLLTMLVDLDHLLAVPVFNPCRCSIGFHPLHSYYAIGVYILLLFPRKTRVIAIGLLLHMLTDGIDCLFIIRNTGC
ncbi:DUF6122 family protein [Paraflavitalea pollutisoli]|uniref:DUF6122 family protein n=1 Tax=Paraflavitalea pollutisoli TaxID=3034143 RepID=UPI003B82F10D